MVIDYHLQYKSQTSVFLPHFSLLIDFFPLLSQNTRPIIQNPPRSFKSSSFWVIQSSNPYISNILFSLHYSFLTKTLSIKNPQSLQTLSMASSRRPSKLTIKHKVHEEQQPNEHDYTRLLRPEHIHRFEADFLPRQVMLPKYGVFSDFDDKGLYVSGYFEGTRIRNVH